MTPAAEIHGQTSSEGCLIISADLGILSAQNDMLCFSCMSNKLLISFKNVPSTIDFHHFWNVLFAVFSIFYIIDLNVNVCTDFSKNGTTNIQGACVKVMQIDGRGYLCLHICLCWSTFSLHEFVK